MNGDVMHLEAAYEGFWSRLVCPHCGHVFEIEGDVSNDEVYTCDNCNGQSAVTGR